MTEPNAAPIESRASAWFTPVRFGGLLALLILAAFPQVLVGMETFVARDYGFFVYPLAQFQRDCFWQGELPFWNPYNNCGVPFLAQWNTMPLYPPALIYLTLPLHWSLSFFGLLHLWFAGLGMFFLARRWTGSSFGAAFAGTAFAFNGFALNLLMWPSHMATFSWMPWVILAIEPAWRMGGRKILIAALAGAMQMLAGGPEIILLTWLIAAALWVVQFVQKDTARGAMVWRFPAVIGLVILLTVIQLLPFLDLVAHAQRDTGFADLRWSMPLRGWVNFLVPMAFGTTVTEGLFFQHGQYWTSSYYLGLGTLWLALVAIVAGKSLGVNRTRIWLLCGMAVVGLIFALGENTPILPLLRKIIPQLSLITYPIKYICVTVFAVPLLAAFALANLSKVQKWILPVGTVLFGLILAILFWTQSAPLPDDATHAALLNALSRIGFLVLLGALFYALTRQSEARLFQWMPVLLVIAGWGDVFTHEPAQNPTVPPWIFQPNITRQQLAMKPQPELGGSRSMVSPAAANRLVSLALANPKDNFLAKRQSYCADCNIFDGVPKVDGFFSLTPRENDEIQSIFYTSTNASHPPLENFMGVSQITAPDAVFHWQARTNFLPLVTAGQRPIYVDDYATVPLLAADDFDGSKMVYLPKSAAALVTATNETMAAVTDSRFGNSTVEATVDARAVALVVVAQTYYHNWHAEVDGRPTTLLRANVGFQAVEVPAGRHQVRLFYRDEAFETGAVISGLAWMGCLGALLVRRRRG